MEANVEFADVATPIGTFRVVYEGEKVRSTDLRERGHSQRAVPEGATQRRPPFRKGTPPSQFAEYFRGDRTEFELSAEPTVGSEFDRTIWRELSRVPAGETVTYGELARRTGHKGAARAVGGAMHRNPLPILIPCHRVVGEDGDLTGFGLGLWRKRWLLDREGAWPLKSKSSDGPRPRGQRTLDARSTPTHRP
jgi:methylated-DNA-[protein]-cysteine S-methyltransferase